MRARFLWPAVVCAVTVSYACVPLLASRQFYMRGDTAAQFSPTWFHLGELVRAGNWPPFLDPGSWAGGNYAAEALFGIYNPLNLLIWLTMSATPNLLVAVTLVKVTVLVVLALGVFRLAGEYGAAPWAAAVMAITVPFSGFTLYWDAGSWPSGLIAFAYAPWVWWAFRRTLNDRLNPFLAFVIGALAITQGNPYGTLAVVIVGVAMTGEALVNGNHRGLRRVLLVGACVAAVLPLVYLPLLATSELAARSGGALFENNGKLRPESGDLLGLSAPTYVPGIRAITGPMKVPATYFAWFLLPLLPWLRFGVLRSRARELTGIGFVTACYLFLTIGPSKLWLFRWPLRLSEYFYLGVAIAFAVVLSEGLQTDHRRRRALISAGLVAFSGLVAWAQNPQWSAAAYGGTLVLVLLTAGLLGWHRYARKAVPALLAAGLIAGSGVVLLTQVIVFGENESSRLWHLPSDVNAMERRFDDRNGVVLQFADLRHLQKPGRDAQLRAAYDDFLPGSMYHVAGVDAVNNYTGMGYRPFERTLCLHYEGFSRPCGFRNVWLPLKGKGPPLVDLMKVSTIVVQAGLMGDVAPQAGWDVQDERDVVTLRRQDPLPWPESRLSWVTRGVEVTGAETRDNYHEQVEVRTGPDGGRAVFAMLDWPGYTATLDGKPVKVKHDSAGLLTVMLPADASGELAVSFRPPGFGAGLAAAGLGTLGAAVLGVLYVRRRRGGRPAADHQPSL